MKKDLDTLKIGLKKRLNGDFGKSDGFEDVLDIKDNFNLAIQTWTSHNEDRMINSMLATIAIQELEIKHLK
ncbi:MAG: hypothetical protein ACRD9Q_03450 [Nitrososphaeraceae archaeon]